MRQELIDLLLGELSPDASDALKNKILKDPALERDLGELSALFSLMRRGEEIEPAPEIRQALLTAAERAAAPSLWQQIRHVPGLMRYRFEQSRRFRLAAVSLGVHLVAMVILLYTLGDRPATDGPTEFWVTNNPEGDAPQRPATSFVRRLELRRLPQRTRLKNYGVAGQNEAIREGLKTLLASQARDGSFGDSAEETAFAALALLAEGDSSVQSTVRGRAIQRAVRNLLGQVGQGAVSGAVLAALLEDYALSYEDLDDFERLEYSQAIRTLIRGVDDADPMAREALALAHLAEFAMPAGRVLGAAQALLGGDRTALLDQPATRATATIVLARGQSLERGKVRAWASGLFDRAKAEVAAGNVSGVVLVTLQAPYRL